MTDKELKHLSRGELLELCAEKCNEVEELSRQIVSLTEKLGRTEWSLAQQTGKLEDRKILLNDAGNIALASLKLNGIFELAQQTADQYLENVKDLTDRQEEVCRTREKECNLRLLAKEQECEELCRRRESDAKEAADRLTAETEKLCQDKISETEKIIDEMLDKAKSQSEHYWAMAAANLEEFCKNHQELRELLAFSGEEES